VTIDRGRYDPEEHNVTSSVRHAAVRGPFAAQSISLGLSAVGETGSEVISRLVQDGQAAFDAGFDGVTISEHHAGFPGYVPLPMQLAGVVRERTNGGWACAGPAVIPLRNPALVAEQLAWAAAAHPGQVGAGFVPGYQEKDFTALGYDFEARHRMHWQNLERLMLELGRGDGAALAQDQAIRALTPGEVSIVTGAAGPIAVRRAARLGIGILVPSLRPADEVRELIDRFRDEGGTGEAVLIRRVHVGGAATGSQVNMERWRGRATENAGWLSLSDDAVSAGDAGHVAELLASQLERSGATAVNVRIEAYADAPEQVGEQIDIVGREVLPAVRAALGW
jgi:alkanesulfonate monooxygenase SsuD/methylene tetrahydromethanopterin reductase-like flavin-dependent oxidoreductase (luciferase family)